ncbi:glycosyltransferase family 25 protein [Rhizobium paknamense]|nr:glycosyltransferase family 25 protein [Rhizobium paknamense]
MAMQVFVINLARATDRFSFQTRQLTALGLAFERVEAVDAGMLDGEWPQGFWTGWERPMSDVEKACFLSHHRLWQRIAEGSGPALILEDDAMLSSRLPNLLAQLQAASGLEHVTLETRARRKLLARKPHPQWPLKRLYQDRSGAAAYVLWPEGARKLLARTARHAAIADAVLCAAYELSSWQADPPLALQLDRAAHYGLPQPLQTQSSILDSRPKVKLPLPYRLRRIKAQLRMGLRQLAHSQDGERRDLRPDPADFAYLNAI